MVQTCKRQEKQRHRLTYTKRSMACLPALCMRSAERSTLSLPRAAAPSASASMIAADTRAGGPPSVSSCTISATCRPVTNAQPPVALLTAHL